MAARLSILSCVLAAALSVAHAQAQVATANGASIVLLPVVVVEGSRDTVIQLVNGSTQRIFARCSYAANDATIPPIAFDLALVTRQATHWVVSRGRATDPTDGNCGATPPANDCDGAGLDPGRVPALGNDFAGALRCVQVDRSRAAMGGNALRALATIVDEHGVVAKYSAVGLAGSARNDADATLCLGGPASATCPLGAEYNGCPRAWNVNLRAEGARELPEEDAPNLHTRLVLTRCGDEGPPDQIVPVTVTNEFEQQFSANILTHRWATVALHDLHVFDEELVGTPFITARLAAAAADPGIAVVAMSERTTADGSAAGGLVAQVPHADGVHDGQDVVLLPTP